MARISGVDIPREKRLEISLTYVFGIGRNTATLICQQTGLSPDTRVRDLTDEEVARIRNWIDTWNERAAITRAAERPARRGRPPTSATGR